MKLLFMCYFQLYGAKAAGQLLTAMGLLCNAYMKYNALTMGVTDILLKPHAEKKFVFENYLTSRVDFTFFLFQIEGAADQGVFLRPC